MRNARALDSAAHSRTVMILGASFATGNMGVSALASGTIASLQRGIPDARIVILDYAKRQSVSEDRCNSRVVLVELLNLRFSKRLWQRNHVASLIVKSLFLRLLLVRPWRTRMIRKSPRLEEILNADLVLSLAGGDSFSDIYGLWRMIYVTLPQILVILLRRPLILLPQTYGPFNSVASRGLARFILRRAAIIYSRDEEGIEVVRQFLPEGGSGARRAYDMGFALAPTPPPLEIQERIQAVKRRGPLVGLNISGLLYMGGYNRDNGFCLKIVYRDFVRFVLDYFMVETKCEVMLFPHVRGGTSGAEDDLDACEQVMAERGHRDEGRIHVIAESMDHHQIKFLIGQSDFFLGSRMHACIAALSQCVPTVGLAYSRKFFGVMRLVGNGAVTVDLRTAELAAALHEIDRAWQARDAMRQALQTTMPRIQDSVLKLFNDPSLERILAMHI